MKRNSNVIVVRTNQSTAQDEAISSSQLLDDAQVKIEIEEEFGTHEINNRFEIDYCGFMNPQRMCLQVGAQGEYLLYEDVYAFKNENTHLAFKSCNSGVFLAVEHGLYGWYC